MTPLTNEQRREKLDKINTLIYEVEDSYPYIWNDKHPIRLQLYRTRIELGVAENQIRKVQEEERELKWKAEQDETLCD